MSRRQRKDLAETEEVTQQLVSVAYTIKGWAMEDGLEGHDKYERIIAYAHKSTMSVPTIVNKLRKELLPDNEIFRNTETVREKGELEIGLAQYMIVGYAPRVFLNSLKGAVAKKIKLGSEKEKPEYTIPWNMDELPLLVVTEILEERPDSIQLWALLRPRNGLCTPFQIGQEWVFYRHEFRDSETSIQTRASSWNRLVAAQSIRPGTSKPLTNKQVRYKKAKDTTKVLIQPQHSFINELLLLVSGFERHPDKWFLQELKAVLSAVDEDLEYAPLPRNTALHKFVDKSEDFQLDDATQALAEIIEQWPEIVGVHCTESTILLLKQALNANNQVEVEYRLLRGFLAQGTFAIHLALPSFVKGDVNPSEDLAANYDETSINVLKEIAETAYACVQRITPPPKSMPPISTSGEAALLSTVVKKLSEILKAGKVMDKELKDLCGDVSLEGSPYDIWAHFADAVDVDTAKQAFFAVVRYFITEGGYKNRGLAEMIEDLVLVLERAGY